MDVWEELTKARTILSLTQTIHLAKNANTYSELEPFLDCADHRIESIMLSLEKLNNTNSYKYWRRKLQNCLYFYMQFLTETIDSSLE